jgi:O-antigen/teichoic acid export membrane protein
VSVPEAAPQNLAVRLAASSFVLAAGSALSSLVAFFTFVAVTRGLGPDAYGHITAATAFLFIPAVLAESGLSLAVVRQISAAPERTEYAMRASVPIRSLVSLAAIGAALGIGLALPLPDQTKVAIAIFALGSLFTLLTVNLLPVLQAQLRMHWAVAANLVGRVAALGLTIAALAAGLGFKSVVAAQVVGLGITFLLHAVVVSRLVSLRPIVDKAYWKSLLTGSIVLGVAIALSQAYFRIDALLLALIRSAHEVGLYGAAYKFIEMAGLVLVAFQTAVFPPLTRFVATGDERARRLTQNAFDVMVAAAAPLAVGMLVFATPIVVATAGDDFREGADALRLLAPYVLFAFANGLFFTLLAAAGRDRRLLTVAGAALTANVALNVAFIPLYGFRGAAVVSVATEALILLAFLPAVRRRGLLPDPSYVVVVAGAAVAMAVVGLTVPGPAALAMAAASAVYAFVLLSLPGTARDIVRAQLVPAIREYVGRARA